MRILTQELINKGKSPRGGIKGVQLKAIGEVRSKGWFKRILGKSVTSGQYRKYLKLRDSRTRADINKSKSAKKRRSRKNLNPHKKKYYEYLNSKEWATIRIEMFISRGKKCELCSSTNRIQVHHLNYDRLFNEEPKDLIILCSYCHKNEHGIS